MNFKELLIIFCFISFVNSSNGPIGYQLFRQIDRISELRSGVQTKQFSSFDRRGGNSDGGPFDCIRKTSNGHCILAEHLGSGEIDSIWSSRDEAIFIKTGQITIELDGIVVVDYQLQALLNGQFGPPFVWPLVGNGNDTSGGCVIKVPMPFKRSMRITVETNPKYYHVTYRTFSDSTGVQTFNPLETAEDVIHKLRGFGNRDPKPIHKSAKSVQQVFKDVSSENSVTIFNETGSSGQIREIRIQMPHLVRSPRNIDDARAFGKQGWSSFYATIDPMNNGIRITRRIDPGVDNQIANISIDGLSAGVWNSSKLNAKSIWAEEEVVIDSKFTQNKTHISIKQEFVSSSIDFGEFRYDIHSLVGGQWIRTDTLEVGPDHPGDESAHQYKISNQTFAGKRIFRYNVDSKSLQNSDEFLAKTRVKATFDGQVTVDAPIGQFFGSGLGMYDTRSLWFGIDASNGVFTTFWPMPFIKEAKIELIFGVHSEVAKDIKTEVKFVFDQQIKQQLESKTIGYFHATHREETTRPGEDYIFLNTTGTGVFYGVSHTMRGLIQTGNLRDYLEGDERVFIDGKQTPEIYGTGTEDFYESGWYFRDGITFDMPFNGNPGYETKGDDCLYDCTHAIRIFMGGVSFTSSLVFGIEHGPVDNNEPAIYSSVAYWYGLPDSVVKQTDFIDVIDKTSRDKHEYKAETELNYQMSSSYEGQHYKEIHNSSVTTASKEISFKASIDANNKGVRIFRTSDQKVSYQCVDVYVDNQLVGQWLQPLGNEWSRFLDDSYDIPLNFTKAKNQLNLKLVAVSYESGPTLWSAINYRVFSIN